MDAISIEEANKIRVAMGMKPLPVPGAPANEGPVFKESKSGSDSEDEPASTLETRQAAASENWQKLQREAEAKAKRQAQKEAIKKARDAATRFAKLEGKGLGDEDDVGDLDTKTWLLQQKKRQKKIEKARRLEQELLEQEAQARADYTSADLAGVKVAHELNQFNEELGEQVLTLKDTAVDDEEAEDELENADIKTAEKLEQRLESKKRKRAYDPMEDPNGEKSILAQYDEEIDGKKTKRFTLDGQGRTKEEVDMSAQMSSAKPKGITLSLDILKDETPISDYAEPAEIKIRKPKKKKPKSSRKRLDEDDDIFPTANGTLNGDMDVDGPEAKAGKPKKTFDENLDDDDLQSRLAASRREALKKRKRIRPEDIAKQIKEEASATPDVTESIEAAEETGLVLDETTEFIANLQRPEDREETPRARSKSRGLDSAGRRSASVDSEGDVPMGQAYTEEGAEEALRSHAERSASVPEITNTGLDDEATLNEGLAGTLKMLSQRGLVKKADTGDLNSYYRERQHFLADKQRAEAEAERRAREQRERDRKSGRLENMSARDREEQARFNNQQRDQAESRKMADIFNKEYRPNVELKYVDEFGRRMTQKEAFKHLSHQFHGKGSGKQKTEKRLKKIDDEKKREAMSSLDSSQHTGMNNAMSATSRKNRQAGVRLE